MIFGLLLHACTCAGPTGPQDVSFAPGPPRAIAGRFVGTDEVELDPRVAFDVQARCPAIRHATATRVAGAKGAAAKGPGVLSVRVEGERLAAVRRVNAGLPDGTLVEVQFVREDDALRFPVMCDACEVWLGVDASTRPPDARVVFGGTPDPRDPTERATGVAREPGFSEGESAAAATGPRAFAQRAGRVGEPALRDPTERATGVARETGLREGESEAAATGPRAFAQRAGRVGEPAPRDPTERATGEEPGGVAGGGKPPAPEASKASAASVAHVPVANPAAATGARVAACFGEGYSLVFEGGRIVE